MDHGFGAGVQPKIKTKMKTKTFVTTLMLAAVGQFAPPASQAQTVASYPPVVIKTVPESGSLNVPPGEFEIKATFSKAMTDQSWSWCTVWDNSCPDALGKPHYDADQKTCVMNVKLEPGKTYGYWLNTKEFRNFRDQQGHSAVPYLLVFSTTGQGQAAEAPEAEVKANQPQTGEKYVQQQLKLAQAGNYWAKFNLWDGYAHGKHDLATNSAEAGKWLTELVKGAYLAKFKPVGGFNPRTPSEMLDQFSDQCHLFSGKDSLGGASFFRTTKQDGKLIGSFLTDSPDDFKAAVKKNPDLKLISIKKVTPKMFLSYEASEQESL